MSFLLSNFLKSYTLTAKVLEIQNSAGVKVFTLNVCNYQKSFVDAEKLIIILQDNNIDKQYSLDFANNTEAIQAQTQFKDAINSLILNCQDTTLTPPSPSQTPIPITYVVYKTKQIAGVLFVAQWYDVTDATNLLGLGAITMRLLAKSINDYEPSGVILGTNQLITITTINDTIQRFEDGAKKILASNNSKIIFDSSCLKITATTNSILTVSSCNNIEINNSIAVLDNCSYIKIENNSNVTINNAANISVNGISQNLTSIGFSLQGVSIDNNNSIGKSGRSIKADPANQTFLSYNEVVEQKINFTTNNNTVSIILDNKILSANGEFKIFYTGNSTGNIINVLNSASTLLYSIGDSVKDTWVIFRFNKTTSLFEFINLNFTKNASHVVYPVNVTSNNQTLFTLPIPASDPTKLQMIINGQDQLFGPDFTYSSPVTVTYQNRNFLLSIGDEVKFLIY